MKQKRDLKINESKTGLMRNVLSRQAGKLIVFNQFIFHLIIHRQMLEGKKSTAIACLVDILISSNYGVLNVAPKVHICVSRANHDGPQ